MEELADFIWDLRHMANENGDGEVGKPPIHSTLKFVHKNKWRRISPETNNLRRVKIKL